MARFIILPVVVLLLTACGTGLDKPPEGGDVSTAIEMSMPDDFQEAAALETGRTPSYVTAITLTVSGDGMETISVNVPTSSLRTTVNLTFGRRRFAVTITTSIGKNFTGSTTATISENGSNRVSIPLELNAPPTIDSVRVSNRRPQLGETVSISVRASDPDGDSLTYSWRSRDPNGHTTTSRGSTFSYSFDIPGRYSLNLTVSDGHDGETSKSFSWRINEPPNNMPTVNGVSVNNKFAKPGTVVTLSCDASDRDGDNLTYSWTGAGNEIGNGQSINYTIPNNDDFSVTCFADDGKNGSTPGQASINYSTYTAHANNLNVKVVVNNASGVQWTTSTSNSCGSEDTVSFSGFEISGSFSAKTSVKGCATTPPHTYTLDVKRKSTGATITNIGPQDIGTPSPATYTHNFTL